VSGGIGSGKGTTINAMALDIHELGQFSMISVDSPIEYLGNFPQVEYISQPQLYGIMNSLKKMDINICLLNEIATQETAREVLNLVVSGVHVMTTLHNQRVYNIFYKLHEQLGYLYTSLIPYLNYVSFQEKYSITCKNCLVTYDKTHYDAKPNEKKLLDFFKLSAVKQPRGCSECKDGIAATGIQVVSEGLLFNDKLKAALTKADLHEQSALLKKELENKPNNMEQLIKRKLAAGDVMIGEVLQKLDTWR
jgi:type II secretory ATPase GspE/PulE/Tfp pilus assembly ATPase PilB-like protein